MATYKFGDTVITPDGQATVVEDQEINSEEVKVQLAGEDIFKIYSASELSREETE